MEIKPWGFWTNGAGKSIIGAFVQNKIDEDTAVAQVREACVAAGMKGEYELSDATLRADVRYYAREARKSRGAAGGATLEPPALPIERTTVGQGGRVVIPASYRDALGLREGDEVTLWLDEDEVHIIPTARVLKRAQALVRRYIPAGRSLADELIAERRREADRE